MPASRGWPNALQSTSPTFFARIFGKTNIVISRQATAAQQRYAAFSIGSGLASLNGGLLNSYLSALTGSNVSLSVMDYEALVNDTENQARRLLQHCGLEWDPACLQVGERQRGIRTASLFQARQPVYRSAVGRWKHYERFLDPLKTALGVPN